MCQETEETFTPTNEDGVIQTKYGTLIVTEEPNMVEYILPEELKGRDDLPQKVQVQTQESTYRYTLYQASFAHDDSSQHIMHNALRTAPEGSLLDIRLCSGGGSCFEGAQLYSIMREKFNGTTTTYNDSCSYSMAAVIFSAGDKRVMNEYSSLMYHSYSAVIGGDGAALKSQFEHYDELFKRTDKEILMDSGFLTKKEFKHMTKYNKQWFFNAKQCAERGIATHIIVKGRELTAEQYIEYEDSGFTIDEYIEYLNTEIPSSEETIEFDLSDLLTLFGVEEEDATEEIG